MKKIFLILILIIAISEKESKAQTGVPDTLAYLQTIVANKANYIGQPVSALLNDLQIQIKYFHPSRGIVYDVSKETSTSFAFYFPQTADDMYLTYPCLEIYWQTPLNANQAFSLYNAKNGGGWDTTVYNFYKNATIKNITVEN